MQRSKATIADVARAAGVSVVTVSRVMNDSQGVEPGTAARVIHSAQELDYRPNMPPQGHSGLVGVLVPDLGNPHFHQTLTGFMSAAKAAGYSTMVATSEEEPGDEPNLAYDLLSRTDGLFLCSPRMSDEDLAEVALAQRPLVLSNRPSSKACNLPTVGMDLREAGLAVGCYLRDQGHRRVVFLSGPTASWANSERRAAFQSIEEMQVIDVPCGSMLEDGRRAAAAAMAARPTALITFNDVVALGAYAWLHERDVRIPDDVSVVSFDDIVFASYVTPPLTTIRNAAIDTGHISWELLEGAIAGAPPPPPRILKPELMVRGSSGPARVEV